MMRLQTRSSQRMKGRGSMQPEMNEHLQAERDLHTVMVAGHGVDPAPIPNASNASGQPDGAKHAKTKQHDDGFGIRDFLVWCGIPIIVMLLIRIFLLGFYVIPSGSMMNTIQINDRVIGSKLTPTVFDLQRGDIVVFKDPGGWLTADQTNSGSNEFLIKRLIGLPGDTVACEGGGQPITVNGVAIDESAYLREGVTPSDFPFSVTVEAGHIFVMGDNRSNSADSRYHLEESTHGMVPIDNVISVALVTYWPISHIGLLDSHREVFANVPDPQSAQ